LAINARRHLGRNWGMPMSRKEQPELITSGPYALIRHPIYSGLMLAMLETLVAATPERWKRPNPHKGLARTAPNA
jgi:protein-S-isoprenylcysteine O-methyltransferase Ste14